MRRKNVKGVKYYISNDTGLKEKKRRVLLFIAGIILGFVIRIVTEMS